MSDILERLRSSCDVREAALLRNLAADEIERLQSRLAEAEALLRFIREKWPYWAEIDRIDAFLAADKSTEGAK